MADSTLPPAVDSMALLAAAVIVHDVARDRVLLIQRGLRAKFGVGSWDLPVGKSDRGEPITATAARELEEETGLVVRPESLSVAHLIHGSWGVEAPNGFLTVVFAAREWSGEPINREPDKHAQVAWVSTADVPEDFVSSTRDVLLAYLEGRGAMVFEEGW